MARPKVNIEKLAALDRTSFMEFEDEVVSAISRDEQARRQERIENRGGRKKRRRRR